MLLRILDESPGSKNVEHHIYSVSSKDKYATKTGTLITILVLTVPSFDPSTGLVGGILIKNHIKSSFGMLGTTFGGNHLVLYPHNPRHIID